MRRKATESVHKFMLLISFTQKLPLFILRDARVTRDFCVQFLLPAVKRTPTETFSLQMPAMLALTVDQQRLDK